MKYGTKVIDNKIFYNDILITKENIEEISQSVLLNCRFEYDLCEFFDAIKDMITPDLAIKMVERSTKLMQFVPPQYITDEMLKNAILKNPVYTLSYVPEHMITENLINYAISINGLALQRVPKEMITQYICDKAFSNTVKAIMYIPNKFKTHEMCKKAVIENIKLIKYVPVQILNEEFLGELRIMGITLSKKDIAYVNACLLVHESQTEINNQNFNYETISKPIPEEIRNIKITDLSDFFSAQAMKDILKAGIINFGQLIEFVKKEDFLSIFNLATTFDEVSNTVSLLKCKYLNEPPIFKISDENLTTKDLYTLLGLSARSKTILLRRTNYGDAESFFEEMRNPQVMKQLLRIQGMGKSAALEIINKSQIIIDYYDNRKKLSDQSFFEKLSEKSLDDLKYELQHLNEERKNLDVHVNAVIGKLQEKIEQSKKGVIK